MRKINVLMESVIYVGEQSKLHKRWFVRFPFMRIATFTIFGFTGSRHGCHGEMVIGKVDVSRVTVK